MIKKVAAALGEGGTALIENRIAAWEWVRRNPK